MLHDAQYRRKKKRQNKAWRAKNLDRIKKRLSAPTFLSERRQKRLRKQIELAGRPPASHCELCGEECSTVWDHCHKTGKFRGWLCAHCNRTIGFIETYPGKVYKMLEYIRSHHNEEEE